MTADVLTCERPASSALRPLTIFVPHASDVFTNHLANGDGLVAFDLASRLALRGHTVHVAAPKIDVIGDVPARLQLHELVVAGHTSAAGRVRYMIAVRRLFERLRRAGRIDIVHQLNPVFTGISLALRGTNVPVVLGSYVADWPSAERRSFATIAKRGIAALQQQQADALLVTTPEARLRIVGAERLRRKIFTVPHGIDAALYADPAGGSASASSPPTVLFLGGLERRKGIYTLIDAFARVHATLPSARLIVAGFGREWTSLREAVAAASLSDAVEFLGGVSRDRIPELMARSSVFCMPSFGEPFGMSLLEAMACGKPVVVTDAGGPAHIVDDAGARKVPPGDAVALADALVDVLSSTELQARLGRHNRELIEKVYSWDAVVTRVEAVYRAVTDAVR